MKENATFHAFKATGKWYTTARGWLDPRVFECYGRTEKRRRVIEHNGGKYPGLNSGGQEFIFFVIGDDENAHGYPLLLYPESRI